MSAEHKPQSEPDVRPWVRRLGSYLRIFGRPAPGTMGYRTDGTQGPPSGRETYLDALERMAKEREAEHGR